MSRSILAIVERVEFVLRKNPLVQRALFANVFRMEIEVLMPILNDWSSVATVIKRLDNAFASSTDSVSILLVDDGSTIPPPPEFGSDPCAKLQKISILRLKSNIGHQRAIAIGLCHLAEKTKNCTVLVMDGDGEDESSDAVRMLATVHQAAGPTIVFAQRTRRSESIGFRFGYAVFKILHLVLTGLPIQVGNFSVIPAVYLERIVIEPMLWNHYAASILRGRLPIDLVPTTRGKRIDGKSRLNFVSLIVHGFSALACYSELIGVRLILFSSFIIFVIILVMSVLLWLKFFTTLTVPGWTSLFLGLVFVVVLQLVTLVSNFTMQIISQRSSQPFVPIRDYSWFVSHCEIVYRKLQP